MTLITGVPLDIGGIEGLAQELRVQCGVGGTVKHGVIELQGDRRERLLSDLGTRDGIWLWP